MKGTLMSDLAVTTLPDATQMWLKLDKFTGADSRMREKLFPILLQSAGRELAGVGVVTMLHQALYDYTSGEPMLLPVTQLMIKPLIEVLVDDEQVKADALTFIDEADAHAKEELGKTVVPPRPELSEEHKVTLMSLIKKLATVYDECTNDPYGTSEGHRKGGANPFYDQTLDGLYLQFSYDTPDKVWTPWGHWSFAAAQRYEIDLDRFMSRLTLEMHIEGKQHDWGYYGPVYAIRAIDGEEVPEGVLPTDKRQYLEYEVANAEWERLFGGEA